MTVQTSWTAEDEQYAVMVAGARARLAEAVEDARRDLGRARAALQHLRGTQLYDVEWAEGKTGADVHWLLGEAARTLRIASVLAGSVQ